jgi:hypothetical protein
MPLLWQAPYLEARMTQDMLTATAAQYAQRWQHYVREQETGRRTRHLTRSDRAWCAGAVEERMARAARDRSTILTIIDAELRGDTCLHHPIIMVPNVEHDPTSDYVLLVDDRPALPPAAQAQRMVDAAHTFTQVAAPQADPLAEAA